jgi:hypothetical protein
MAISWCPWLSKGVLLTSRDDIKACTRLLTLIVADFMQRPGYVEVDLVDTFQDFILTPSLNGLKAVSMHTAINVTSINHT